MKKRDHRGILGIILVVVFLLSLLGVDWHGGVWHTGGVAVLRQIVDSMFHPDLSVAILKKGFSNMMITFSYALISISIATLLGLVLGTLASGLLWKNQVIAVVMRAILGFLRAVHELVWAWIFVAAVGLNPIGALLALAIPYAGALGKVYADLLGEVDKNMIENMQVAGASRWQCIVYGYFPEAFKEMLSYTLYRLECAIRSSSVLSFVGLGGLGFQINLALQDLNYSRLWIYVYFLILLVLLIDIWGNSFRRNLEKKNTKFTRNSLWALLALFVFAWWYVIAIDKANFFELFNMKNAQYFKQFIFGLVGVGDDKVAFFDGLQIIETIKMAGQTVVMSVLAIGIAFAVVLLTMIPAAKNVKDGKITGRKSWILSLMYYVVRILYLVTRALPELLWAMIFVFIFKPGIVPGAMALGVHNIGVLGKLCCEVIEEMDDRPVNNIALTGAGGGQILVYGVLPEILTKVINYMLYRWEVIIRTTIVVGFVGAGGLGMAFKLAMSFFHYSQITLYMIAYLIIVYMADFISYRTKEWIR